MLFSAIAKCSSPFLHFFLTAACFSMGVNAVDEYDFVIMGAGTAGCVLASKLCTAGHTVALLERAEPRTAQEDLEVKALRLAGDLWLGTSPLVENIVGLNQRLFDPGTSTPGLPVQFVTGNTLGGTSTIAAQMVIPPNGTIEEWGIAGLDTATAFEHYASVYKKLQVKTQALLPD
jgi:choline dehydrogenase-like flavoprotein